MIGLLLLAPADIAVAIDLEKMVMPGPLSNAHADLESECSNCHAAFDRGSHRTLCLSCHEDVDADINRKEGLHGRHPLASVGDCRSCHAEHTGRDADIRGLSDATFDHGDTDFALLGSHTSVECADCHAPDVTRREAPSDCFACHESDDVHRGELSQDCAKCHDSASWSTTQFDHDETSFPLTGRHMKTACVGCHAGSRYAGTPSDCVSCHAIDDAHRGRFGTDCAACHDTKGFADQGFDHEEASGGFALSGAHARAECASCHRQPPGERELPESCSGCHASEDKHAGRFGTQCSDCHSSVAWKRARFDHDERTEFPLHGAHASVSCETCHTGPTEALDGVSKCAECHASDDVHQGSLGNDCAFCHNEKSFEGRIAFDHDLTDFPLLGLHAVASCEQCHVDQRYSMEEYDCVSCHGEDDEHGSTLGPRCSTCHNPNAWDVWRFDHDQQTGFELHGRHEALACSSCHTRPTRGKVQQDEDCLACHARDDVHRGGFGKRCQACHGFEGWSPAKLGR